MDNRSYLDNLKFWVVLFSVFVGSCAAQEELRKVNGESPLENLVEVQPASPSKPFKEEKNLLDLALPQTELVPKKPRDKGPRFSLSAEEVEVKSILLAISKEIDQNIMIDPMISKKVTLNLEKVTLKEMLDHVLLPLNLRYEVDEGFIQVIPREMQTRVFHLNYLISNREGSGSLQASLEPRAYELTPTGIGLRNLPGSSQIISSEETDLWKEISLGLQQMVSFERSGEKFQNSQSMNEDAAHGLSGGKGWFSVNRQAGVIVVKANPEVLLRVAEYLEEVEGSVQRQVFIQARIVKIVLKDEFPARIDWNRFTRLNSSRPKEGPPFDGRIGESQGFLYGNEDASLDEMLEALSYLGEVSVLASPKITALNNQRAVINVRTEDTFFIHDTTQPEAGGGYIPQPVSLGVVLNVVPQINVNGNVMMNVHTSISKKTGERVSPDGLHRVPVVDVRESSNVVLARNGQTVVVGGLMGIRKEPKDGSATSREQIPFLQRLFHDDLTIYEKSELVILLTPEIMVGEAIDDRRRLEKKRLKRFVLPRQTYKMQIRSEGN